MKISTKTFQVLFRLFLIISACVVLIGYYCYVQVVVSARLMLQDISEIEYFHVSNLVTSNKDLKSSQLSPLSACENGGILINTSIAVVSMLTLEGSVKSLPYLLQASSKLYDNLRRHSNMDLILMVFDSKKHLSKEKLKEIGGWTICYLNPIEGPLLGQKSDNRYLTSKLYSKLHIWNFVEYDLIVYLDLDVMVVKSLKPLFQFNDWIEKSENKKNDDNIYNKVAMVPDGFSSTFNAGVILLCPNATLFRELVSKISTIPHNTNLAEQSYLNVFFKGRISPLLFKYNAIVGMRYNYPEYWRAYWKQLVIIHYTCKPWEFLQCRYDQVMDLCLLWWYVK